MKETAINCQSAVGYIEDRLDGQLDSALGASLEAHLGHCLTCRQAQKRAAAVRAALRGLPVEGPSPGFAERALRTATQQGQGRTRRRMASMMVGGLAAGLAIGIGLGAFLTETYRPGEERPVVTLSLQQAKTIRLMFDAERPLSGATLTVHLPDGVEIVGFPGSSQLTWSTDLARGKNVLALPIIAREGPGGDLVAHLAHGERHRIFRVDLTVHQAVSSPEIPLLTT